MPERFRLALASPVSIPYTYEAIPDPEGDWITQGSGPWANYVYSPISEPANASQAAQSGTEQTAPAGSSQTLTDESGSGC
jgi:hypothetical protein